MNIDSDLIIEALAALTEKKDKLIDELYEQEEQESRLGMILLKLIEERYFDDRGWFAKRIKTNNQRYGNLSDKKLKGILEYFRDEGWSD